MKFMLILLNQFQWAFRLTSLRISGIAVLINPNTGYEGFHTSDGILESLQILSHEASTLKENLFFYVIGLLYILNKSTLKLEPKY